MILLSGLALTANACSPGDVPENVEKPGPGPVPNPEPEPGSSRSLVVYFSCTNMTKGIAEQIAAVTGSDTHRIIPEVAYAPEDLDYNNVSSRANREQNDPSARPAIGNTLEGLTGYDILYLGYPIWWGKAPKIISTFLEAYDLSGVTVVPFCTSHSSGIGTSDTELHVLAPRAEWKPGKRFAGNETTETVRTWITGLNLDEGNVASFDLSKGENGKAPTVRLNSGYDMPIVGLGTYSLLDEVCVNSVVSAIRSGFRKFDTANMYHNEESVGEGIRLSGVPREDIFVCTKLYPNQFADADNAIDLALQKLGLGYIDLMLLHHPGSNDVAAYKAMERAVAQGKIRSIGLSNYYIEEMERFLPQVTIRPALVQNEIHPYYQENDVIPYMHRQGIVVEAWYPLGGRGHTAALLNDPTISRIANNHGKSSAQVILRWDLQKGVVVIPGSSNPDHIEENISLFDFELTEEEMRQINALDRNEKHDWY